MPQTPPGTSQGLSESRVGDADAPSTPPPVEPRLAPRPATPRRTRRTGRTVALAALALLLLGLVGLELLTRFWLRMGDPPLYMTDPQCEYLMVPSRSYDRLRAHTTYNAWSMRATPDFPKARTDTKERRILVFGDSVLNGGPWTDDAALATRMVANQLRSLTGRPTVVANISAGGWSPGNMLGYARKFGLFDADTIIIVLNNGDAFDHPTFRPLGRDFPTSTPALALQEVAFRYLPNWLESRLGGPAGTVTDLQDANPKAIDSLRELAAMAKASGARLAAVLHPTRSEVRGGAKPGTTFLQRELAGLGIVTIDARAMFANALDAGLQPYRDDVHPNREGQEVLAAALREAIDYAR